MTDNETVSSESPPSQGLERSIDWKQGIIIAMGVPILILPSLYDLDSVIWGLSCFIWVISVCQGFLQNLAIGELSATFGVAGIGAAAQYIFTDDKKYAGKKVNWGRFIGAFTAWSYWFTWTPVIPIYTMVMGSYITDTFNLGINATILNLILGAVIYSAIIALGSRGLGGGAAVQLILAIITILPLAVVAIVPFFNGTFSMESFTNSIYPNNWEWSGANIALLIGTLAVAQWSACAWESVATYGSEYKNPGRDVPKGLVGCGLICLLLYFLVPVAAYGVVGHDVISEWGYSTLIPLCISDFGNIGSTIAIIMLIAGMVMLIQTAFLGSSRTLFYMSKNGNMPKFISRTTITGAPIYAMLFQMCVGLCLIPLGTPGMILAASSFGFCFAIGMAMLAFLKARRDPRFKNVPRTYKAPRGWTYVAGFIAFFEFFVMIPCLAYESYICFNGPFSVIIGALILLIYVPIWFLLQRSHRKEEEAKKTKEANTGN